MGRGNKSSRGSPNRGGRGFRGGRGQPRGRGRGFPNPTRGRGGGYIPMEEIDFPIQMYSEESSKFGFLTVNSNFMGNIGYYRGGSGGFSSARFRGRGSGYSTPRGMNSPRGRGRGQSGTQTPNYYDVGSTPSRGRGSDSPYGQQRGRGFRSSASKLHAGAPLSKLLYEDRPLLRPIVFVRSVYTATLFQEDEDILKAAVEEPGKSTFYLFYLL